MSLFKKTTIDEMMNDIRSDLASLGVHIDTFVSEAELVAAGGVEKALEILDKKGDFHFLYGFFSMFSSIKSRKFSSFTIHRIIFT